MAGKACADNAAKPPVRKSHLASLGKPPGRVPFIIGHRLEFCKRHVSGWQEAAACDPPKTGPFYDKTANAYIQEIGYDFDIDAAGHIILLGGAPKQDDNVDHDEDHEAFAGEDPPEGDQPAPARAGPSTGLDAVAIAQKNSAKRKVLRMALGHWFRNNANGPGKKKSHNMVGKQLDAMVDVAPEKPRRAHADQFFSSKHYDSLVKDRFDAHFRTVASAWQTAQNLCQAPSVGDLPSEDQLAVLAGIKFEGDDLFQGVYDGWLQSFAKKGGKLVEVTLHAAFTRAVYSSQPDDFKEGLKQELDDVYGKAMETYRQLLESADAEKTPEYYHEMQSKAAYFLYPFAEHASKKLGLNVSVMVYGPISARGRAIGVKSVHVGSTNDPMGLEWMDADSEAYQAMVNSMKGFADRCFTKEERAARALPAVASGSNVDPPRGEGPSGSTGVLDAQEDATSLRRTAPCQVSLAPPSRSVSPTGRPTYTSRSQASRVQPAASPHEGRSVTSRSPPSPPPGSPHPFTESGPVLPCTPAASSLATPHASAFLSKEVRGPSKSPLFLPSSSPASVQSSRRPGQNAGVHGPLPSPSFSITHPLRTVSLPAPQATPSADMPPRRFVSAPTAGYIMQLDHPASSSRVHVDPQLEQRPSAHMGFDQDGEPEGLHTPPSSPLIPEGEPLVAPSFSAPQLDRLANGPVLPYVRRPFQPHDDDGMSRELDELAWTLLEDKREAEWNAAQAHKESGLRQRDAPSMGLDSGPKTPMRPKKRVGCPRQETAEPPSQMFSPTAPPFTQRFTEASSSPTPSSRSKPSSAHPHVTSSWPPSQPPPNAIQAMEEASRCRRPAPPMVGPMTQSVATRASTVSAEDILRWPGKMREVHGLLTSGKDWGESWATCVSEWVELECMDGFQVDVKLNANIGAFSSASRPEPVGRWIAYKRTAKDRPVGSLKAYTSAWWAWWGDCQPSERGVDKNGRPAPPSDDLDWSCMDVTTSCGLVLITVSLSFWGAEIFTAGGASSHQVQEWEDAVSQTAITFACIRRWKARNVQDSAKRKSVPTASGSSKPRKCRKT